MVTKKVEQSLARKDKTRLGHSRWVLLLSLAVGCLTFWCDSRWRGVSSVYADGGAQMEQAIQLYRAQQWDQSLYALQQALRELRGKSSNQRVSVYLYMGLCLYQRGDHGLAWKAFEQALSLQLGATLPKQDTSPKVQQFFQKVQQRFLERLGASRKPELSPVSPPSTPGTSRGVATGRVSPWPWIILGVSAAALTGGIALVANASSNQSEIDTWLKSNVAEGQILADLETSAQSTRSTISAQNIAGGVSLAVAGLGIAGAIVLFVLQGRQTNQPPALTQHSHTVPFATFGP